MARIVTFFCARFWINHVARWRVYIVTSLLYCFDSTMFTYYNSHQSCLPTYLKYLMIIIMVWMRHIKKCWLQQFVFPLTCSVCKGQFINQFIWLCYYSRLKKHQFILEIISFQKRQDLILQSIITNIPGNSNNFKSRTMGLLQFFFLNKASFKYIVPYTLIKPFYTLILANLLCTGTSNLYKILRKLQFLITICKSVCVCYHGRSWCPDVWLLGTSGYLSDPKNRNAKNIELILKIEMSHTMNWS